jgi:hypothetical protein
MIPHITLLVKRCKSELISGFMSTKLITIYISTKGDFLKKMPNIQ